MIGWLIALGVIALLGMLPLGICGSYDAGGALLYLSVGPVRIPLYPARKREKEDSKGAKTEKKPTQASQKQGGGGKLTDFIPLVKTVLAFLGALIKKITVKRLDIKIVLAGSDPCDLSIHYGRACAAVGNLQPHLDRLFRIRKQNIAVQCDYTADESVVTAYIDIRISLARLLILVIRYGVRAIKEYFIIYNKRKGGAEL